MEEFLGGWGPGWMVCQSPQRTRWAAVTRQTGQRGAQNGLVRSGGPWDDLSSSAAPLWDGVPSLPGPRCQHGPIRNRQHL
ncbi:hypothetical protein CesoFtcFv8_005676 [Champsocephalus esox]|uniref:Uncharacterized protein n=2 Tax=Champsocephalus TaxID=52236 RepID=A0AAN8DZJ1_CHAGU|nr:hypothetical protein CesoFtcFv8_025142 [Champsocephalus esox]KAK5907872.1 hypothetical protein CesoFtcFv8_005676 [Champsocephalus esox]KAK5928811.1 hypothetical protein CgunFtcFv8_010101 [Champsocephalus gunnari]KAK5931457.1 hypothetical protein CgunFtcFv8_027601 [Champsocephalus gunnari]KAK5934770.1 hypothetical protein CgunFtcFv8_020196 [Champsocephalus gunnari]